MSPQICLIGWPEDAVESALREFDAGGRELREQARRINEKVRAQLAGAVHGVAETLAGSPAGFEAVLAAEIGAAKALAGHQGIYFGGPDFAETWRFWAYTTPALQAIVVVPPPPSGEGREAIGRWLETTVTGIRETAGAPRQLVLGFGSAVRALRDHATRLAWMRREDEPLTLDWLDSPELPAAASMLFLGLQLLSVHASDLAPVDRDDLLLELAEAAHVRWRLESRAQGELRASRLMLDDLQAGYAGAEARVLALGGELARAAETLTQTEASYRSKLDAVEHERRYLEEQLAQARAYIASVRRTPVYRGFAVARKAGRRIRLILARR